MYTIRTFFYIWLIIQSICAVDFDGIESSGVVPSDPKVSVTNINPELKGLQWTRPEISLHGLKHAYSKHLGPLGKDKPPIFDFNDGSKAAKQATIDLVEGILNDPIAVQKGMGKDGSLYTGYLGEYNGHTIEIRIAEQASKPGKNGISKVKPGELSTVVRLNETSLSKNWPDIKRVNGSLVSKMASQLNDVSLIKKTGQNINKIKSRVPSRVVKGIKGASSIRAADLIPGREAVRDIYAGNPGEAIKTHLSDSAKGLPVAAGAGVAISAMPALARAAPPVGAALVIVQTGETVDEVITQQTGESTVSKFRQAIGTRRRTHMASPDYVMPDPNAEVVIPTITKASPEAIAEAERRRNRSEWQKRWDCAKRRFNIPKLEFGISELFRGCHD